MTLGPDFGRAGWVRLPPNATSRRWAAAARGNALARVPLVPEDQWRAGGTWCVGLDLLDNAPDGSLPYAPAPDCIGAALQAIDAVSFPLHRAQVSLVRPGYPAVSLQERDAAHRFRLRRDAAHVDGLIADGADGQRFVREWHGIIIGIALNSADAGAAPLVVWSGSHRVIGPALRGALADRLPSDWDAINIAAAYKAARARVFETCARRQMPLAVGEAVILHRHMVHGIAPWEEGAEAEDEGRMVAYFRPVTCQTAQAWVTAP